MSISTKFRTPNGWTRFDGDLHATDRPAFTVVGDPYDSDRPLTITNRRVYATFRFTTGPLGAGHVTNRIVISRIPATGARLRVSDHDLRGLPAATVLDLYEDAFSGAEQLRSHCLADVDPESPWTGARGGCTFLSHVADRYDKAGALPHAERAAIIAAEAGVSEPTARRWISEARKLGYLPRRSHASRQTGALVRRTNNSIAEPTRVAQGWTLVEDLPREVADILEQDAAPASTTSIRWLIVRRGDNGPKIAVRLDLNGEYYTVSAVAAVNPQPNTLKDLRTIPLAGIAALATRERRHELEEQRTREYEERVAQSATNTPASADTVADALANPFVKRILATYRNYNENKAFDRSRGLFMVANLFKEDESVTLAVADGWLLWLTSLGIINYQGRDVDPVAAGDRPRGEYHPKPIPVPHPDDPGAPRLYIAPWLKEDQNPAEPGPAASKPTTPPDPNDPWSAPAPIDTTPKTKTGPAMAEPTPTEPADVPETTTTEPEPADAATADDGDPWLQAPTPTPAEPEDTELKSEEPEPTPADTTTEDEEPDDTGDPWLQAERLWKKKHPEPMPFKPRITVFRSDDRDEFIPLDDEEFPDEKDIAEYINSVHAKYGETNRPVIGCFDIKQHFPGTKDDYIRGMVRAAEQQGLINDMEHVLV